MTGSGSGPLGLLLMIAPLAAIPVFAIVGVPQFAPVSASQGDDDGIEWNEPASRTPAAPAEPSFKGRSADDLYAPVTKTATNTVTNPVARPEAVTPRSRREANPAAPDNSKNWLPPPEALDQWEVRPDSVPAGRLKAQKKTANGGSSRTDRVQGFDSTSDTDDDGLVSTDGFDPELLKPDRNSPPARRTRPADEAPVGNRPLAKDNRKLIREQPGRSIEMPPEMEAGSADFSQALGEQAGWQSAAKRLKELGIRKYRLESQIEEQTFLFVCNFTSPENPRVIRRFEADADTPLEAVQLVLQQIDEWRSRDGRGDDAEPSADDER